LPFTSCHNVRQRSLPSDTLWFTIEQTAPGYPTPWNYGKTWTHDTSVPYPYLNRKLSGTQITESDGNLWPPRKQKGEPIGDHGSEFYTRKTMILNERLPFTVIYMEPDANLFGDHPYRYRRFGNDWIANAFGDGTLANCNRGTQWWMDKIVPAFDDQSSTRSALNVKGSIAIAAVSPSNQIANAASAVGELLQDVPSIPGVSLWKSRLKALEVVARSADEFLNLEFGILPTISDMKSFVKATHKLERRYRQFLRDAGRNVRREYVFPEDKATTTSILNGIASPVMARSTDPTDYVKWGYPNAFARCLPVWSTNRARTLERRIWFKGAFTYHLPHWFDSQSDIDRQRLKAQLIYGAKPDLNTMWQLAPWSWAVDWFSDAGALVKNLQALITYGTILRYGYVMEETIVTDVYSAGPITFVPTGDDALRIPKPWPVPRSVTLKSIVRKRIQANPFGFGVSWEGLSPVQLAITTALGITRVVR